MISSPIKIKLNKPTVAIMVLCLADIITTAIALSHGAKELNPLIYVLGGVVVFLIIKGVLTAILCVSVARKHTSAGKNFLTKELNSKYLWIAVGLFSLVIVNNLLVLFTVRI